MGNVLSFVFASFYVVSSYYIYGNFIYPMLIRNYRKGLDINFDYFKEQILREEDKVITHAIKTGFPITGNDKFYQGVLNG